MSKKDKAIVRYVVLVGNVCDGFQAFGPFADGNDATDWAEANAERFADDGGTWVCMTLLEPKEARR